ncbi:M13 family metallopeptidase [Polluticaenibacter yanchengensis]|uniref:M13 family metallopeptidase n=1 Tax=Polluticaenibacter yanchengensis TaxID=3014562 RepID=A0ABT4ULD6_9BACT|nr:M13 family metallopeptidase [Chitinophagaceae bacterium LY-5]
MYKKLLLPAFAFGMVACNNNNPQSSGPQADFYLKNIDSTVNPADDFFGFANGTWLKNNPIPDNESSWGVADMVQEDIYERLRTINENAIKSDHKQGTVEQKIADFWKVAMDTARLEKEGTTSLKAGLEAIDKIQSLPELIRHTGYLQTIGVGTFIGAYIGQDDMNSDSMLLSFYQAGIGLPERSYYFDTDAKTVEIRNAYKKYVNDILTSVYGKEALTLNTNEIYAFEEQLAKNSRKLEDMRDPYENYNKTSFKAFQQKLKTINLTDWFNAAEIPVQDSINIMQPAYYSALDKILAVTPLAVLKDYLKVNYVSAFDSYLDKASLDRAFAYSKVISGAKEMRPRWKRVIDNEEGLFGEALGKLFVSEYFDATAKKRYETLVENVKEAYRERIKNLTWMSDSTKTKAYEKLKGIKYKVGYPDKWTDFSSLELNAKNTYLENIQSASKWHYKKEVAKLGKPVDREEWFMSPQTYNAYYNPPNNEIVLPAGIFAVPGIKDAELDEAFVYGYAGASTIGHELTHGFDDQGRLYDAKGNLSNWWTAADGNAFNDRAKKIINQFNNMVVIDTFRVNGNATQGENIADLGGILIGLDAYKKTASYKSGKIIGGYTPLQRYFLGYAFGWLYNTRNEKLISYVKTNVHSPAKQRVNGPFANVPEFYEAFGVKPANKMYLADSLRVHIW